MAPINPRLLFALTALLMVAYCLPWLVSPGVGLTPGAYDLAEWTSLHPQTRSATPPLLPALLLRLPLVCIAWILAFASTRATRGLFGVIIVMLVVALLPPPEFVRATADPNYRQQAALALVTLVGAAAGLSGRLHRLRRPIVVVSAFIGLIAGAFGLAQSYALMQGFSLPVQPGAGVLLMGLGFAAIGLLAANAPSSNAVTG